MAEKDGLQQAVDFTKLLITLDSGLIAFLTGTSLVAHLHDVSDKVVFTGALVILATSLCAGLLACMRAATMFSTAEYGLNDQYLKWPGLVNVICFGFGAVLVGMLAWMDFVLKSTP